MLLHQLVVVFRLALYTSLRRKAPMGLNYLVIRDAREPLKCVDVLCEALEEQLLLVEEANEGVGERRPEFSRIELVRMIVD